MRSYSRPRHGMLTSIIMCFLVLMVLSSFVMGTQYVVSVQSQDQASMEALTQKVDEEVMAGASGPSRVTLGAIEATMSRVVDADAPFVLAEPPSVPTMALLSDISYDDGTSSWVLQYRTEQSSPSDELNHFSRILYASKAGNAEVGDLHNPCLAQSVEAQVCVDALKADYIVADAVATGSDSLDLDTAAIIGDAITVSSVDEPHSRVQTLTITIPHTAIRNYLASEETSPHPVYGDRVTWRFGLGMVFVGSHSSQSNVILFDTFNLVEISNQLVTVSKSNSYSIARHVSFYTQRVVDDESTADVDESEIYVAKIEYMLADGHALESIESTINEVDTCASPEKAAMQAKINNLANPGCITSYQLCDPVTFSSEQNGVTKTWATLVVPIVGVPVPGEVRISTLLHTIDTSVTPNTRSVSSLNFATGVAPQDACAPESIDTFNPIDHTVAELYRGVAVEAEAIDGYFSVYNSTGETSSTTDSLLTVVIRPKDAAALAYFDAFPAEQIRLDDVYMAHALPEATLPESIDNVIHTVDNGRAQLLLDSALVQACPQEVDGFVYEDGQFTCVTTHDWSREGGLLRPASKSRADGPYFVYSVTDHTEEEAKAWLKENVIGQLSESADTIAANIYAHTTSRVTADYTAKSKVFWMWPVYYWPDASPVGLKDHTIVSLAWSLAKEAPASRRRLLSTDSTYGTDSTDSVMPQIGLPLPKAIAKVRIAHKARPPPRDLARRRMRPAEELLQRKSLGEIVARHAMGPFDDMKAGPGKKQRVMRREEAKDNKPRLPKMVTRRVGKPAFV